LKGRSTILGKLRGGGRVRGSPRAGKTEGEGKKRIRGGESAGSTRVQMFTSLRGKVGIRRKNFGGRGGGRVGEEGGTAERERIRKKRWTR